MAKNVLLAGATGGIGSALLEELLGDPGVGHIFATTRAAPGSEHPNVSWLKLDYLAPATIEAVAAAAARHAPTLDTFICATGYLHGKQGQPEKSLAALDAKHMEHYFRVNAAGPLSLFAACAGLLRSTEAPQIAFLSAQVGSIEDNHLGGWYSYRMAKAALNMGIKSASVEVARWGKGASVIAVHPGTTHSRLSEPFVARRKAAVRTAPETARKLYQLFRSVNAEHNGRFLTADGDPLPW